MSISTFRTTTIKLSQFVNPHNLPVWKRSFDIFSSALLIIMLSPVLIFIYAAVRLTSRGPAIYSSPRAGQRFTIFPFYKFRSMYVNADTLVAKMQHVNQYGESETRIDVDKEKYNQLLIADEGYINESTYVVKKKKLENNTFFKVADDPRITPIGKIIRNTSMDELPQLFNVLLGHMSLVGNRPLPIYEAEKLTSDQWVQRFDAPSGITGLWQVGGRGGEQVSEEERKILDIQYAESYSWLGDINILLRTIPAVLQKANV